MSYVGIKASAIVGYDCGVMYFDNVKNVPFSEIEPNVEAGHCAKSGLADRIPYEMGGLLRSHFVDARSKGRDSRLRLKRGGEIAAYGAFAIEIKLF